MIKQIQHVLRISNNVGDRREKETIQAMLHAVKLGSWVTEGGHGMTRNKDGDIGHSGAKLNKLDDEEKTKHLGSDVVTESDQTVAFSTSLSAWLGFEYQYLNSYKLLKLRMFRNCVQTGRRESRERFKTTVVISLEDGGDVVKQKQIGVELGDGKPERSSSFFFKHLVTCTDVRRMALRVCVYVHHGWARKCTCIAEQSIAEQTVTLGNCDALTPRSVWLNVKKNTMI